MNNAELFRELCNRVIFTPNQYDIYVHMVNLIEKRGYRVFAMQPDDPMYEIASGYIRGARIAIKPNVILANRIAILAHEIGHYMLHNRDPRKKAFTQVFIANKDYEAPKRPPTVVIERDEQEECKATMAGRRLFLFVQKYSRY